MDLRENNSFMRMEKRDESAQMAAILVKCVLKRE